MASFNEHPKFEITKELLSKCMPHASKENIDRFYEPIKLAMSKYGIDNKYRIAAFLATICHESGSLRYVRELASGEAYEGRQDLGNTEEGDGKRFLGRGLVQLTGRANYAEISRALDYNFLSNPEALEKPGAASLSAGWFWSTRNLNRPADIEAFLKIQIKVNGKNRETGLPNHWPERLAIYNHIKTVLKIPA
jgi:putative chitinase